MSGQVFKNKDECVNGIKIFQSIIKKTEILTFLEYGKIDDTKWLPKLKDNNVLLMKREIPLALGEKECRDWALEIERNVDAEIRSLNI